MNHNTHLVGKIAQKLYQSLGSGFSEDVASHASVKPTCPESRELAEIVLGRHLSLFHHDVRLRKLVICGHYLQITQTPFVNVVRDKRGVSEPCYVPCR
jgi:hypothetical protein